MTSKAAKGNRLEAEIEKSREEANWKRVIELAEQLKSTRNFSETLGNFLIAEGKLELYLEENPPIEANVSKATSGLADARKYLELCIGASTKKHEVSLDALLAMSKLEFACGHYNSALKRLDEAGLHQLTEKCLPTRSLRVVAESYAIKGLCLEKTSLSHNSKIQLTDRDENMIRCFELAGDLTLLYLQEQDKLVSLPLTQSVPSLAPSVVSTGSASPLPPIGEESKKMGIILETALQRAPIIYMKSGKIDQAIARYRNMLMAVESSATQNLRLTLSRQLAEVLLRGCSECSYLQPLKFVTGEKSRSTSSSKALESPWKPKKYSGSNLFLPKNVNEEIILLLLISEAMAVREAVLSQSPEFATARTHAYNNATAVYDLLCIALARRKQYQILIEVFERSMKFSFEAHHVWEQFGLVLACSRHLIRALRVLREAHRLQPTQPHCCLLAARMCFQHLGKVEEGLEWVNKAIESLDELPSRIASRCFLYQGLGLTMKAIHSHRNSEVQAYMTKAFEALTRAQQMDSTDHLVEYYLAFHSAQNRQLVVATQHVKLALFLRCEHPPSLLLLILLMSAQKENEEALKLCETAVKEYPEHLQLLYIKASLEEELLGCETALLTAKHMLALWISLYKDQIVEDGLDSQSHIQGNADNYSVFNMSDKDTVSAHAESMAASRIEAALSEVASSLSSYHPRRGPQQAWLLQIQIWLLTAHLYLKTNHVDEAANCIQEASSIFPMSHHIMFMRGYLHEKKREFEDALLCYQNSLSINPYHTKSLRHLAIVYHYLGKDRLSEKTLLDAIRIDPLDHMSWCALGDTTAALSQLETATKCYATALEIEASTSILPFSSIPFCYE